MFVLNDYFVDFVCYFTLREVQMFSEEFIFLLEGFFFFLLVADSSVNGNKSN